MLTKANENRVFGYLCRTAKTEKKIFKKTIFNDRIELDLPHIGRKITQCFPDFHQPLKQPCNKCNTINVISIIQ